MTTVAEIRQQYPTLGGLDDEQVVDAVHSAFYRDRPRDEVAATLGIKPAAAAPAAPAGVLRTIGDMGIKAAQGVVGLGQSVVGAGSLVTGGAVGKGMRAIGYDPERTNQMLAEGLSESQLASEKKVQQADGFTDTVMTAVQNPRSIAGAVVESLPAMLAAGGISGAMARRIATRAAAPFGGLTTEAGAAAGQKALEHAAGRLVTTGAAAEGAQTAGSIADQAQAAGRDYGQYAVPAVVAGLGTAAIGKVAGKVMGDAETALFTGAKSAGVQGSLPARVVKGVVGEGLMEEMPQSAQEQVMTNLAMGKPALEGVGNAAAMGAVTGSAMGAGMGAVSPHRAANTIRETETVPEVGVLSAAANVGTETKAQTVENSPPVQTPTPEPEPLDPVLEQIKTLKGTARTEALAAYNMINRPDVPKGVRQYNSKLLDRHLATLDKSEVPLLGYDTTPTGKMVAGPDGVRVETRADEINRAQREAEQQAEDQRRIDLGLAPVRPRDAAAAEVAAGPAEVSGAPIDKDWTAFAPESGTKGVPRADMPQIKAEHRGAMVNFLKARGIDAEQAEVPANTLKPTQAEFSPEKVLKAAGFTGTDRSILVSSDGHVLDGHHQWLAKLKGDETVKVIRLNAPIADLLTTVKGFPSATTAEGQGSNTPNPQQALAGIGKGITEGLYGGLFKALQNGETHMAGIKDPVLAKSRAAFDAGLIKSPEDLRDYVNKGYPSIEEQKKGAFATLDEAKGYISDQRKSGGTRIEALPVPHEDGSFGVAIKDSPDWARAQLFKRQQELVAAGVKDGDIARDNGEPFLSKKGAQNAMKKHPGHQVVAVQGGFVLRKEVTNANDQTAAPAAAKKPDASVPAATPSAEKTPADTQPSLIDPPEVVKVKDVHGRDHHILKSELESDKKVLHRHSAAGVPIEGKAALLDRENIASPETPSKEVKKPEVEPAGQTGKVAPATKSVASDDMIERAKAVYQDQYSRIPEEAEGEPAGLHRRRINALEQVLNPERYHPVSEVDNPQDLKIGDRVMVSRDRGGDYTGTVSSVAVASGKAYTSGFMVNIAADDSHGGWVDLDSVTPLKSEPKQPSDQKEPAKPAIKSVAKKTEESTKSDDKATTLTDAGEKIGGARKDRWKARGLQVSDLDEMSEGEGAELATKANVWKPDYAAMVEAGTEPEAAARVKMVYDALAAKPKQDTPAARRLYVTMMQHVRDVFGSVKTVADAEAARLNLIYDKVMWTEGSGGDNERARRNAQSIDDLAAHQKAARALLFSVYKGRADPFYLYTSDKSKAQRMVADGFPAKGEPWKIRFTISAQRGDGMTPRGTHLTMDEAAKAGTPVTADQVRAGLFVVRRKQNGDTVAVLTSKADAEAAAKTIYEGEKKTNGGSAPEPTRPHLDVLERKGLPARIDRDVSTEDFLKDFGFRGVEFGNWSAQDERQRILNMAYDGLADLAEMMGVPKEAMSLNGTLGMAFGARGGGKALAHYEPGKLVINMTKLRGGGSLAHEWAHALDHYFGELQQPDAYTRRARGASGWYNERNYAGDGAPKNMRPEMAAAFDRVMSALFQKHITKAEFIRQLELKLEQTEAVLQRETGSMQAMFQRSVDNQKQALAEARKEPEEKTFIGGKRSDYALQAQKLSGKTEGGYWIRPTEMFARAFESWAFDRLTAMGAKSDYLVHGVESDRFAGAGYKANPYPAGVERDIINAAFENLAKTIKTKTGDDGKVALYAKDFDADAFKRYYGPAQGMTLDAAKKIVTRLTSSWKNGPRVVVVDRGTDLPKGVDTRARGAYIGGAIYIVASNNMTADSVARTLAHEAIAHYGLRQSQGEKGWGQLMAAINRGVKAGNKDLVAIRDYVRQAYKDENLSPELEADEIAARVVERGVDPVTGEFRTGFAFLKQVYANLASFLRRLGIRIPFTVAELNGMLVSAMQSLETGKRTAGGGQLVVAAARGEEPTNLPPVIIGHTLGSAKDLADYEAAKAGDKLAAVKVAKALVTDEVAEKVRAALNGAKPVLVPVTSEEASGRNKIPAATALVLAQKLGLETTTEIVQSNAPHRKKLAGLDRIFASPEFDGKVEPGTTYLMVDDALTQGATFAALASHIQQGGGTVVGAFALTGKQYSATMAPTAETLQKLNDKYGDLEPDFKAATGYGFDALTQSEARYLASFEPADAIRDRIAAERRKRVDGRNEGNAGEAAVDDSAPRILHALGDPAGTIDPRDASTFTNKARDAFNDIAATRKTFNWWNNSVGTQYQKAAQDKDFKKVYDATQGYILDVSRLANDAADRARDLLPRMENLQDVLKDTPLDKNRTSKADVKAISKPIFQGTLADKRQYSTADLKKLFKLTDKQVDLYKQFQASVGKSLDDLTTSTAAKLMRYRGFTDQIDRALELGDHEALANLAENAAAKHADMKGLAEQIREISDRANTLKAEGYAPLMRFGQYAVSVRDPKTQALEEFHLFESEREANKFAREYKGTGTVDKSVMAMQDHQLLQGISPESLELFGDILAKSGALDLGDEVFQQYLRNAVDQRSAMKRMIERQGYPGYSQDVRRVLATFVTSNARLASKNLHFSNMLEAVEAVPKSKGDVRDEATRLVKYVQNPVEEASKIRGLLFAQYIGGSVASALVNMTQSLTMTLPYLSQFSNPAKAAMQIASAMKQAVGKVTDRDLSSDLAKAEQMGVVSPQEIHHLNAEAMATFGSNPVIQKAMFLWGGLFSVAEQYNRRVAFIAAWQGAKDRGESDPYAAASKAVEETQGVYNKGNRPDWARGALGATLFTFKQFSISYLEFLTRLPTREKALALAILMLASGAEGLPFADDIDDVIDTIAQRLGYSFNSKQQKRQFIGATLGEGAADFLLKGVSAIPGMPIDIAARMGMANLIPGSGILRKDVKDHMQDVLEVAGVAGSVVKDATQGTFTPVAIRNLVKAADMFQTGMYRDQKGRRVVDADAVDALWKGIGFQPVEAAKASASSRMANQTIMLLKETEADIADDMANARFEQSTEKLQAARDRLKEWNEKNPDTPISINSGQINKRVREMRLSKSERMIRSAPKDIRAEVRNQFQ